MTPTDRNGWIDLLRAFSAMAIALFHFNRMPATVPPGWLSRAWHGAWLHGYLGVGVFFALSGFCIFPGWSRAPSCLDFLLRRARRIFPPYWGSLLLVAGLALGARLLSGVNDVAALPRQPQAIFATVLLLTDPVTTVPTINWVYWTLSCIVVFYLLTGLTLLWPVRSRVAVLAGMHVLLCLINAVWAPAVTGPFFFIGYWGSFGLGLALAVAFEHRKAGRIMLLASAVHAAWTIARGTDPAHLVAAGVVSAAFLALCRDRLFPASLRAFARLGEISYSLYLVHVPIGIYLLMRFLPAKFADPARYIGSQLLLLAVVLGAAGLFYLGVERPFLPKRATVTPN